MLIISKAVAEGGKVVYGGRAVSHSLGGFFVEPALIAMKSHSEAMSHELFVPILYVLPYKTIDEVP